MRLALYSNLFPPLYLGGYEIGAARVVRELRRRGHEVLVLTARQVHVPRGQRFRKLEIQDSDIHDEVVDVGPCVLGSLANLALRRPWWVPWLLTRTLRARARCRAALDVFAPDLVLLFNPLGVLAPVIEDCLAWGKRHDTAVRAYVSDFWQEEWPLAHPLWRMLRFLAGPTPRSDEDLYCSRFLHERCGRAQDRVVPWGVPGMEQRRPLPARHFQANQPLTLLFAGQLEAHKGLVLLLRALVDCRRAHRLVILGDDATDHARACRRLVVDLGLSHRVTFAGKQSPKAMPALLPALGQVLVVPSLWQEPLSLTMLDGMAAGLPVIASRTGGTPEAICEEETGFLFNPDRRDELTRTIDRLEEDRGLCHRIGTAAQEEVRQRFTIEDMVDQLLQRGVNTSRSQETRKSTVGMS